MNLTLGGLNNGGLHESSDEDCLFLNIYVPDVETRCNNFIFNVCPTCPVILSLCSSGPMAEATTQGLVERLTLDRSTSSAMGLWWSLFDTGHPALPIAQARHPWIHVIGHRGSPRQHGHTRSSCSIAVDPRKRCWLRRGSRPGDRDGPVRWLHGNNVPYVLALSSGTFPPSHLAEWNWRICSVLQAL